MQATGGALEIVADGERLISVLEHVIRNAQDSVGGGSHGEVSVSVEQRDAEAEIAIADTGAGMDARFVRERLFRPFDSTKGSKGMGIGAYQAREYVRALGGDVEVQSSPGRGTRFLIRLPLAPAQRAESRETANVSS
jgi:signal transduction histidine kinase